MLIAVAYNPPLSSSYLTSLRNKDSERHESTFYDDAVMRDIAISFEKNVQFRDKRDVTRL